MSKLKRLATNPRILILLAAIVISVIAINPRFSDGVQIQTVAESSPAANATPAALTADEGRILSVNGVDVNTPEAFYDEVEATPAGESVAIQTTGQQFFIDKQAGQPIGVTVTESKSTNLELGLDLAGGTRVILEPERSVNASEQRRILSTIEQRINAFGLSDASVTSASELSGGDFIIVEVPGVSQQSIVDLLRQQGRFEARIGDETIITGEDVQYICRQAQCSGLVRNGCQEVQGNQWSCQHRFSITISDEAAQRQAEATRDLSVEGSALSKNITFIIDNETVQSLTISPDLQGQAQRELSISGTGTGATERRAQQASLDEMRRTQAVLETGSLPVDLNIVKTDTISPALGAEFTQSAIRAGLLAVLVVVGIVLARYQEWRVSLPMVVTMLSEVTILLGAASLIGWNIDMAAIAAIIIAVGSGVDDQIVITDETVGRKEKDREWSARMDKAFFIIFAAFFTLVVAMLPLLFAGAGLLRGFALTTIIGVTAGVLISRPAYAAMLEILLD